MDSGEHRGDNQGESGGQEPGSFGAGGRGRDGRGKRARGVSSASLEKLFDRLPPQSLEAEMSLLGSLLLEPSVLGEVLALVSKPEQFYSQAHASIFKAIVEVYDKHRSGDLVQISEALSTMGVLEPIGGAEYLVELAEAVPSARNAARYAQIVADKARLRRVIDAAGQVLYDAYNTGEGAMDAGTLVDAAQQAFFDIAGEGESSGPERLSKLLSEELLRLEAQEGGSGMLGVPTGYEDLDKLMSGLQPSELIILAARPSMGKTALALNLAEQVAFGGRTPWHPPAEESEQRPVGIFSLEMSKEALALRLISSRSGVDAQALRTGELTKQQWEDIREACDELYNAPMYIDDSPGLTILQLRAKARRMKDRFDIQALFIDYLQLLTAPGAARESRQVEVSTISRQIKSLARELKIPVVCLAQLNRGAEQRERNRPRMSDLRESGSIEQDADVIMLLHREAYYHKDDEQWMHDPENEDKINLSEVIIAKQRNGPTGVVKLTWDGAITRFKTMDQRPSDPYGGGYGGPGYGTIEPPPGGHPPAGSAGSGGAGWASSGGSSDPRGGGYTFAPGQRSGPVDEHRDGGGPSRDDFDDLPPF